MDDKNYCFRCGGEAEPDNHVYITVLIDGDDLRSFVTDICSDCMKLFIDELIVTGWEEFADECE